MGEKTDGDALAFPEIKTKGENGAQHYNRESYYGNTYSVGGMTKREYFSSVALQGILSSYDAKDWSHKQACEGAATGAVAAADALIEALNRKKD